jgi:two-component system, LuxR family, response regulator FixJ
MLQVAREEIRGARLGGGLIMNDSPAIPVIAIVDDDKSVRESLASLVESVGYEVAVFSSAEEFLRSAPPRDDLRCLILDVRMPGMSGFELYTRLSVSHRSIPTIFITAHADPAVIVWATKPGVVEVLYKPFHPGVLLEAVRSALTKSAH